MVIHDIIYDYKIVVAIVNYPFIESKEWNGNRVIHARNAQNLGKKNTVSKVEKMIATASLSGPTAKKPGKRKRWVSVVGWDTRVDGLARQKFRNRVQLRKHQVMDLLVTGRRS